MPPFAVRSVMLTLSLSCPFQPLLLRNNYKYIDGVLVSSTVFACGNIVCKLFRSVILLLAGNSRLL